MLRKSVLVWGFVCCAGLVVRADTVQLKDKFSVTGKVLAEKRDQVVVDLGFTVLSIPRNQIVKILKGDVSAPPPAAVEKPLDEEPPAAPSKPGLYAAPTRPGPASNVRDLVKRIGEAVVQ